MKDEYLHNLNLFKSFFKGREDIFAIRWEKGNKSGYMPACNYDPYLYRLHKIKGGSFQDYNKSYLPYTNEQIAKHLRGEQLIGIYPLLKDNTSWFIAADFDKANWKSECKIFLKACAENKIPAYLERSRSGNGGHIWIFFDQSYPAVKSRKILISLLEKSGIFSMFDKNSSFDRLFPNQDSLSGKGFGNLIALPLHKPAWNNGNSCFIDPVTFEPFADQWEHLRNIQRISVPHLDNLYSKLIYSANNSYTHAPESLTEKVFIRLNNSVYISRTYLPLKLVSFLKDELNFVNTEYLIKKKTGKNTWGTEHYFRCLEETDTEIIIPRGMTGKLLRFCKENKIEYVFKDERQKIKPVVYKNDIQLREYQVTALEASRKKDMGVIVAPPGTGKTVIALNIIAEKQLPALIVVHRKQLADQWMDRIQSFLGVPKNEIGRFGQGKGMIGNKITIALIQSLKKEVEKDNLSFRKNFGTIIIDECHHIPADTYRNTISNLYPFYSYGLTATPFRKYNDGKLIFIHLGEVIAELKPQEVSSFKTAQIIVRNTELDVPFNSKTDRFETLSKILVHDSARNSIIFNDIIKVLSTGKKAVILTERKEHIETLNQYLKQKFETITLSGDDTENSQNTKWKILKTETFRC